uniref:DUF306 domain-containing protein n=1 Tax=Skeletonema marinoi TaxID=267567 RepID=A0A7S2PXD6_9STRA|mmetsp:Transcript_4700/g.8088  ORF Transcript_4700/g.8088 Transcript_4700/m.8088 type:complete len:387 (+) Transcript_4700:76-1236(+)
MSTKSNNTQKNLSKVLTVTFLALTLATPASGHTLLRSGNLPIPDQEASTNADADSATAISLIGTEWQAYEIEGEPLVPTKRGDITLFFDSSSVSGFAGCNGFSAEWETVPVLDSTPTMFSTGMLRSNRVYCGEVIMQQEGTFLEALRQESTAYSVSGNGDELTLYATAVGEDNNSDAPHSSLHVGRPLVRLVRISSMDIISEEDDQGSNIDSRGEDERDTKGKTIDDKIDDGNRIFQHDNGVIRSMFDIEGWKWELASIKGYEAFVDRSPVTLSFDKDSISGFDGCNTIFGSLDILSIRVAPRHRTIMNAFRVDQLGGTRRGCPGAAGKQASMLRSILNTDQIIYDVKVSDAGVAELELYTKEANPDGSRSRGELLAIFTRLQAVY